MTNHIPPQPANSFRMTLTLEYSNARLDNELLKALREQNENEKLKTVSRAALKKMFGDKKIFIKGQRAKSSSTLSKGVTYVDILL